MTNPHRAFPAKTPDELLAARLGEEAGCVELGMSLYELATGDEMVFHFTFSARSCLSSCRES